MDQAIRWLSDPRPLRDPVLIAAIHGVGNLTPGVVASLFDRYEPEPLAEVDSDAFYDFSVMRPLAAMVDGERVIQWPAIRFHRIGLEDRDLVVLSAIEPNVGWRRLGAIVAEVAEAFGIREAVLVSCFPGGTPHTRPIPVQWLGVSRDVPARFGAEARRPRYQGPATFGMALGVLLRDAGMTVGTLNAIAPFYLGVDPNPFAVRALARAIEGEFGVRFDLEEIERLIAEVERQASEQLAQSAQLRMFLGNLEQQHDEVQGAIAMGDVEGAPGRDAAIDGATPGASAATALPDAERVLADVEALLRGQRDANGPSETGPGGSRQA